MALLVRTKISKNDRELARDISYAGSAKTRAGRAVIRSMETLGGRVRLIKRAEGYQDEIGPDRNFWQVMADRYGLGINVVSGDLNSIPATGPLVLIANHPFGILDGLLLGNILSQHRGKNFRILANGVFQKAKELNDHLLPVSFDGTRDAMRLNLETRQNALNLLADGGAVGIFPGGTVSTSAKPFSRPLDPAWRNFTAKMIAKSGATVVPIYFEGQNSRLFQIASHLHYTLRMGLLVREFKKRTDAVCDIRVGRAITADELAPFRHDANEMMHFLRHQTYTLAPKLDNPNAIGFEFEERYRAN